MEVFVTYFEHFKSFTPHYILLKDCFERIRSGKIQDNILHLRSIEDKKQAKEFKTKSLPCILFAGKFSGRADANLVEHSGLTILDFDHVDVIDYKERLTKFPFVVAAFVSPSGDGLKVVCRIPVGGRTHRGYFKGIEQYLSGFQGFDSTSVNEARVCFESYDADIYVNMEATEFSDIYIMRNGKSGSPDEEAKLKDDRKTDDDEDDDDDGEPDPTPDPTIPSGGGKPVVHVTPVGHRNVVKNLKVSDYELVNRAVKMIVSAADGEKHKELIKAARLCGGWIATGKVQEGDAVYALEKAIQSRDIDDFDGARKTIKDGIKYGKELPIMEQTSYGVGDVAQQPKISVDKVIDCVSTREAEQDYMNAVRTQTLPYGLSTGFHQFDQYFRFKPGNFVIINGHDNVGKSSFIWFMAVLSNVLHGWKWILFCAENTEGQIRKSLMQYKTGKAIHMMNQVEYEVTLAWAYDNFTIIKSEEMVSWEDILVVGTEVNKKKHHDAFLIDPYNALNINLKNSMLSSHEYHYMVTSQMRNYCKKWNTGIYLNCHAITEALRRTHKDGPYAGFPTAPNKADTEGGGKFSNRADEFITIHRYTQHPTDYNITEVHVRKVKETETGGRPTLMNEPIKFKMEKGYYGFFEPEQMFNPIINTGAKAERAQATVQRLTFKEEEEDEGLPWVSGDAPF